MSAVLTEAPFPGLRFFDERTAHLFFGRDEQIDELLDKLNLARLVAVIGPSGWGKSSLVRAGLIPALHSLGRWRVANMRPRDNPIRELAVGLEEKAETLDLETTPRRGSLGLLEATLQIRLEPDERLLVIADQFEELFRFQRNSGEAASFVKLLLEATKQREIPVHVLLTMRSDYLGHCTQFRDLPEQLNEGLYLGSNLKN